MTQPQSGILGDANTSALFLTFVTEARGTEARALARALATIPELSAAAAAEHPAARLSGVVAVGSAAWEPLFGAPRPRLLRRFRARAGAGGEAPATPGDVLLHLRGDRQDLNFALARAIVGRLGASARLVEEVQGFRYLDSRDLIGFVDGTENPTGDRRATVALVGDEDPDFAGGSYVAVQRYRHDLDAWERLAVDRQERIIGRSKVGNIEFTNERKPPSAHIKRVAIRDDGRSVEILRHSMPYGTTAEHGLYFIAYGRSPDNFDRMLDAMILADAAGHHDHLLGYTRALTGTQFFASARDWLTARAST